MKGFDSPLHESLSFLYTAAIYTSLNRDEKDLKKHLRRLRRWIRKNGGNVP